jgi:hypothetical protein
LEKEGRKATDVLLALESKVDTLLTIVKSYDLNQKILSNKMNSILQIISDNKISVKTPGITVEAVMDSQKNIPISSEHVIPVETNPIGFRRTSRPETYAGDNSYVPKQTPLKQQEAVVFVPPQKKQNTTMTSPIEVDERQEEIVFKEVDEKRGSIPVQQRVVDKNGKSIFLADVEVFNENGDLFTKVRTNGAGKWQTPLAVGTYKVIIQKLESLTKERVKVEQSINIDGRTSTVELPMVIIK